MKVLTLEQGSQDWLNYRANKITASDVPVILGESPYKTKFQLWEQKLGLRAPQFVNAAMQRGLDLEPQARACFCKYVGFDVEPMCVESTESPWMMASLDGLSSNHMYGVEIKCSGKDDHELAKSGNVPSKYYGQLQAQMYCADLKNIIYFSYVSDDDHCMVEVARDVAYIDNMILECKIFLHQLESMEPPALCERDFIDMTHNSEYIELERKLREVKFLQGDLILQEELIKKQMQDITNGQPARGPYTTVYKTCRQGAIDYKKIPELQNVDLEKYRKPGSSYWTVRINEGKSWNGNIL